MTALKLGAIFPQTEIGADPGAVRAYVQAVEDMGYHHLVIYDHVLGADTRFHQPWSGLYTSEDLFHEPFVVFSYMAALTTRLELTTAILILGQRQTALVAKQAAEVDVLSGGRLRLGIGVGWNAVEYEALGQDFHNRGRRSEEQIALMRALWTRDSVNVEGQWHRVTHAGINPLPVQRPIPVWIGFGDPSARTAAGVPLPRESALRRIARTADGWFPLFAPDAQGQETLARMRGYAREAGRDASTIGVEGRLSLTEGTPDTWTQAVRDWTALGATHLMVNTMRAGLHGPDDHIEAVRRIKVAVDTIQ
jgi:probable F420-dependent oxidoreductase